MSENDIHFCQSMQKNNCFMKIIFITLGFLFSFLSTWGISPSVKLTITKIENYPGVYGKPKIQYEKIYGKFTGELNPENANNKIITDLSLAEKNRYGFVEYTSDFFMIKPKDLKFTNEILRYDAPNRSTAYGSKPDSVLMARGYIFLSAAWEGDVDKNRGYAPIMGFDRLYLDVPIARNNNGSEITGKIRVEFAPNAGSSPKEMALCGNVYNAGHQSYAPVSFPGNKDCILTKRKKENDPRRFIPNQDWAFSSTGENNPFPGTPDSTKISLRDGFDSDYLYELIYVGKNPKVMGIGLAVVRDMVTFFKNDTTDVSGTRNPVYGKIRYAFGTGTSQSGNFMKTFLHLGFNESLNGTKVFDAIFPIVAARQNNINMRFAVPGGGGGPRTEHRAYGQTSVRAFQEDHYDEITGNKGGILTRATKTNTVPKIFMLLTSSEMWALQASPIFTNAYGTQDLHQPKDLRIYYIAGAQHSVGLYGPVSWDPKSTVYPSSTIVDGAPVQRALWIALEEWVVNDIEPPASQIPEIKNKTLVFPEDLNFPKMKGLSWPTKDGQQTIPEFNYKSVINNLSQLDFGPWFNVFDESGIVSILPPAYSGHDYGIMVSQIDQDGNEIAGIRTTEIQAPLGTSFGFNYDSRVYLEDLAGLRGGFIPFHKTKQARIDVGDSRSSLEERYGTPQGFIDAVKKAAYGLVEQRFLLKEDADKIILKASRKSMF